MFDRIKGREKIIELIKTKNQQSIQMRLNSDDAEYCHVSFCTAPLPELPELADQNCINITVMNSTRNHLMFRCVKNYSLMGKHQAPVWLPARASLTFPLMARAELDYAIYNYGEMALRLIKDLDEAFPPLSNPTEWIKHRTF